MKHSQAEAPIRSAPARELQRGLSQQLRIFERCYRMRAGNGLGLAIARALSEAMGGTIQVRSSSGEGSLFTVTLPR